MQQHLGTCFQLHLFQWLNNPPWNTLVSKLDSSPVRASAMHSLSSFWQRNSATTFYPTLDTYIEQGDCVLCSFVSCVHKYNVTTVPEEKPLFSFFLVSNINLLSFSSLSSRICMWGNHDSTALFFVWGIPGHRCSICWHLLLSQCDLVNLTGLGNNYGLNAWVFGYLHGLQTFFSPHTVPNILTTAALVIFSLTSSRIMLAIFRWKTRWAGRSPKQGDFSFSEDRHTFSIHSFIPASSIHPFGWQCTRTPGGKFSFARSFVWRSP